MMHSMAFQLTTQSAHEEDINEERIIDEGLPNAPHQLSPNIKDDIVPRTTKARTTKAYASVPFRPGVS